jgi:hypothetical protein
LVWLLQAWLGSLFWFISILSRGSQWQGYSTRESFPRETGQLKSTALAEDTKEDFKGTLSQDYKCGLSSVQLVTLQ